MSRLLTENDHAKAVALAADYIGLTVDLDDGIPFDIYDLFADVMDRDYDRSEHDELLILEICNAWESAQSVGDTQ